MKMIHRFLKNKFITGKKQFFQKIVDKKKNLIILL